MTLDQRLGKASEDAKQLSTELDVPALAKPKPPALAAAVAAVVIALVAVGIVVVFTPDESNSPVVTKPSTATTTPISTTTTVPESSATLTTPIAAGGVIEWSKVDAPDISVDEIRSADDGFVVELGTHSSPDGLTWESGAFPLPPDAENVLLTDSDTGLLAIGVKANGLGLWRLEDRGWVEFEIVAPETLSLQSPIGSAWRELNVGLLRSGAVITVLARLEGRVVTQALGRVSGDQLLPVEVPWLDMPGVGDHAWILEFDDRWLALAIGHSDTSGQAWESTDAITWRAIEPPPFLTDCPRTDCGVDFTSFFGGQAFPQRDAVVVNPVSTDESFGLWRSEDGSEWIDVTTPAGPAGMRCGGIWAADSIWVYGLICNDRAISPMWISIDGAIWERIDISEIATEVGPCTGCVPAHVAGDTIFIKGDDSLWVGAYRP